VTSPGLEAPAPGRAGAHIPCYGLPELEPILAYTFLIVFWPLSF